MGVLTSQMTVLSQERDGTANTYTKENEADKEISFNIDDIKMFEDEGTSDLSEIYNNLGDWYYTKGDYYRSLYYFKRTPVILSLDYLPYNGVPNHVETLSKFIFSLYILEQKEQLRWLELLTENNEVSYTDTYINLLVDDNDTLNNYLIKKIEEEAGDGREFEDILKEMIPKKKGYEKAKYLHVLAANTRVPIKEFLIQQVSDKSGLVIAEAVYWLREYGVNTESLEIEPPIRNEIKRYEDVYSKRTTEIPEENVIIDEDTRKWLKEQRLDEDFFDKPDNEEQEKFRTVESKVDYILKTEGESKAAKRLAGLGSKAIPYLIDILQNNNPPEWQRLSIVEALGILKDERAVMPLADMINGAYFTTGKAKEALLKIGTPANSVFLSMLDRNYVTMTLREGVDSSIYAVDALDELHLYEGVGSIIGLFEHEDYRDERMFKSLSGSLHGLTGMGLDRYNLSDIQGLDADAWRRWYERYFYSPPCWEDRLCRIQLIGDLNPKSAFDILESYDDDGDWRVRKEVIALLSKIGGKKSWAYLVEALTDPYKDILENRPVADTAEKEIAKYQNIEMANFLVSHLGKDEILDKRILGIVGTFPKNILSSTIIPLFVNEKQNVKIEAIKMAGRKKVESAVPELSVLKDIHELRPHIVNALCLIGSNSSRSSLKEIYEGATETEIATIEPCLKSGRVDFRLLPDGFNKTVEDKFDGKEFNDKIWTFIPCEITANAFRLDGELIFKTSDIAGMYRDTLSLNRTLEDYFDIEFDYRIERVDSGVLEVGVILRFENEKRELSIFHEVDEQNLNRITYKYKEMKRGIKIEDKHGTIIIARRGNKINVFYRGVDSELLAVGEIKVPYKNATLTLYADYIRQLNSDVRLSRFTVREWK